MAALRPLIIESYAQSSRSKKRGRAGCIYMLQNKRDGKTMTRATVRCGSLSVGLPKHVTNFCAVLAMSRDFLNPGKQLA